MVSVLMIDDDPQMRKLVSLFLRRMDYEFIETGDSVDGEAIALNHRPDIVLLDLMMGKQDGYTTCKNLREKGFTGYVLILSGVPATEGKAKALFAGADAYLEKPVNPLALRLYIEQGLLKKDSE